MRRQPGPVVGIEWVVAECRILDQMPDDIDAKTVDAAPQPEAHGVMDGGAHLGVAPVEVGLGGEEGVIVVLAGRGVVLPGAAAKLTEPVVRWTAARRRIAPDVPLALGRRARRAAVAE